MKLRFIHLLSMLLLISSFFPSRTATIKAGSTQPRAPGSPEMPAEQSAIRVTRSGKQYHFPGNQGMGTTHLIASPYDWHTFYGSDTDDYGAGVAVAGDGSVYMTGQSGKSWLGDSAAKPLHPFSGTSDLVLMKLTGKDLFYLPVVYGSD